MLMKRWMVLVLSSLPFVGVACGTSMMAGTGKGGVSSGGTVALGGDAGVGGANPDAGRAQPDGTKACALYCSAYAKVCPQTGFGAPDKCTRDCVTSLELDRAACSAGKRAAYDCIGNALVQSPGDCNEALAIANQQCGSAIPQVDACNATCLPSIFGDGTGCRASAECSGLEVDLHCLEANSGTVPCTCSVGGKEIWDVATGFGNSKTACTDARMFRLCLKELP